MDKIVFLEPNSINETPFTTSKIIAIHTEVNHHAVTRLIQQYESSLNVYGKVRFKNEPLPSGQSEKIYELNEQQSTLLITFMKNKPKVVSFKEALVWQFYAMKRELQKRQVNRDVGKHAREALTNAISELPESPHKYLKYKHYTDLGYAIVLGKNTKQLKEMYGINKMGNVRDYFTAEQLLKVEAIENQISVLIVLGYSYSEIKSIINKKHLMLE